MGQAYVGKPIWRLFLLAGAAPVAFNELLHMAGYLILYLMFDSMLRQVVLNSIASPSATQLT
jgi:hypothetical protein